VKPVHILTEQAFHQATICVEYRLASLASFPPAAYAHALGLRYGLAGMAAAHHLLLSADPREESRLESDLMSWQDAVAEHVRFEVAEKLPFETLAAFPTVVGRFANEPIYSYLTQHRRLLPFEYYLEIAVKEYEDSHRNYAAKGWPWWKRGAGRRLFHEESRRSLAYAEAFFRRRESGLEEVPEIALLGE
jgi:hypothetical protein